LRKTEADCKDDCWVEEAKFWNEGLVGEELGWGGQDWRGLVENEEFRRGNQQLKSELAVAEAEGKSWDWEEGVGDDGGTAEEVNWF
jgi:hypothetical protein